MLAALGREIIRKVRGAIGMGVFGAVGFIAFGALVTVLSKVLFGYTADFFGNLLPLAGTGFVSGVLAAIGIATGAKKEGGISTGRAFVAGLPLGVIVQFFSVGRIPLSPEDPAFVGFYLIAFLLGSLFGFLGAAAVKIAETPGESGTEDESVATSASRLVSVPDPLAGQATREARENLKRWRGSTAPLQAERSTRRSSK